MTKHTLSDDENGAEPSSRKGGLWDWLKKLLTARNSDASLKESLEEVFEEYEEEDTSLGEEERSIIRNTLTFSDKTVDDVMVPRADIVAVETQTPADELLDIFSCAGISRLPVFRESLDDVIAMVHIKDVVRAITDKTSKENFTSLRSIQRPILYVPGSMKLMDLLIKMQTTRIHMALVVDEYGGTDGLLTIEDLVEQIVGDIEDEHDEISKELLSELPDGSLKADARVFITELEDLLGLDLLPDEQDDDVDTLGGLVFTLSGSIPAVGDVVGHPQGLTFEILAGDERKIQTVLIKRPKLVSATNEKPKDQEEDPAEVDHAV